MIKKLKCIFGLHKFKMLYALSEQAALIECERCSKRFAMKMEGDCQGMILTWNEEVREFYKTVFNTPQL